MTLGRIPAVMRRQGSVASWLVAAWAIGGAVVVSSAGAFFAGPQTWDALRAESGTFARAIRDHDQTHVYAFVRGGVDVNAPVSFADERLTGGRTVRVAPLVLAAAVGNEGNVLTLLSLGARLAVPDNAWATCVADWSGDDTTARTLEAYGGPVAPVTCPPPPEGPVLAFLAR